jgi:CheY-like chemotaxis protein
MTSINGKSVLIIDDDAAMLRALNKVLSGEGAVVTSSFWAGEAMEHLINKPERFDLIITDLRMPILGGQAILGAVAVAFPQVPLVIITAFASPELEAECLRTGAAAFLEKPLDTPQLLAVIEGVFSSSPPSSPRRTGRQGGRAASSSRKHPDSVDPGLTHKCDIPAGEGECRVHAAAPSLGAELDAALPRRGGECDCIDTWQPDGSSRFRWKAPS